jgi:hypothetical protein
MMFLLHALSRAFATRPGLLPPVHVDLSSDPWSPDEDHGKTL